MSYALRNTIILLITLFLFVGAGFGFTKFYQQGVIDKLNVELQAIQQDYESKKSISDQYPDLLNRYTLARDIVLGYDKALFTSNDPDDIYDYLSELNGDDLELYFDFVFADSTQEEQYGIVNSDIQGVGVYSDFVTFLNKLENSELLNKVNSLSLIPVNDIEEIDYVDFTFKLQSYYRRGNYKNPDSGLDPIRFNENISVFNPFRPLILNDVPPNTEGLIDVQRARLLGMTGNRIFLVDGDGKRHTLKVGDKVYLGYLESIDTANREVIFNLDKGGIQELFTMKVER